ncbi:Uu.00g023950.m01.CDS01 [Anthostomella pinea]|uniref:Uu.00g023950.m01.CDS01 n=1 Tax=Anthostomella pinea TaxID=933095 RepID=A0AAI8VUA6_9PEZI|nr:Uu.00g023950.m01.CDS01 [Anthostomella pinea]
MGGYQEYDHRRRSSPIPTNGSSLPTAPPIPRVTSPPPRLRSPLPRADKLSMRLRSNSGLALHTNEAALSQYIDYKKNGSTRPNSFSPSIHSVPLEEEEDVDAPRSWFASSGRSRSWTGPNASFLPFMDFLGRDAFQMALDTPGVIRDLMGYCKERRCEEDLEFLLAIREYTQSTDEMTSILTAISAAYIAPGAMRSLKLPTMVSRSLNADIKRIANATLPSLEAVFLESRSHIERRMAANVFPGFVKTQLTRCTAAALSTGASAISSSKLEYPGLGESFCLTNASGPGNAITAITDGFLMITGYPLQEVMSQDCIFLEGPYTDQDAIHRIQTAVKEGREAVELILNYRKDATPFWNLLFVYPLKNQSGRLEMWLEAQINVSDCVGSRKDLLRVMGGGEYSETISDGSSDDKSELSPYNRLRGGGKQEIEPSVHSRTGSRGSTSSSCFLQQFRKGTQVTSPLAFADNPSDYFFGKGTQTSQKVHFLNQRFQPRAAPSTPPTTYSRHILLRCHPVCVPPSWQRAPTPSGSRKKHSTKLHIAYYSDEVAELLCLRGDVTHQDIFHVLTDKANSPSVTKSFKSLVRERIECGKSTSAELMVDTNRGLKGWRKGSTTSTGPGTANSDGLNTDSNIKPDKKWAKNSKQERVMSHWTPMRNGEGNLEWVILILAQAT